MQHGVAFAESESGGDFYLFDLGGIDLWDRLAGSTTVIWVVAPESGYHA